MQADSPILSWLLSGCVVTAALFAIYCRYHRHSWYGYAKPIPLLTIIFFFSLFGFQHQGMDGPHIYGPVYFYHLVMAGLCLGLAGDFLLLKDRLFVPGLISFLLGHLAYTVAWSSLSWSLPLGLALLLPIGGIVYGVQFTRRLRKRGRTGYFTPVWIYLIVITGMVMSATSLEFTVQRGFPYTALGAVLFWFSDGILAWNRMIRHFYQAQFWTLGTYYTAQTLLVFGAMDFLRRFA